MKRTHTCGELSKKDIGRGVILQGWVQTARDHGGVIFVDLRDRYGITQVKFNPEISREMHALAESLKREYVIECEGRVIARPKGMENPSLATGDIEVECTRLDILNKADTPPIEVDDKKIAGEDLRLKWRYLDLRRPGMQRNLAVRHKTAQAIRKYMSDNNFLEIETPFLVKSTPEGARDYIVPSRVNKSHFYALPQSPQLYKQILMVGGCDRYFQIVRCLRDEDLRADRQPEFTQIDFEMSFVQQEDVMNVVEGIVKTAFKAGIGIDVKTPFKVITYKEAMDKYGIDKPDLRFGMELVDVGEIVRESEFSVFKKAVESGGQVKCINAKACGDISRKQIEGEWTECASGHRAKGLAWMKFKNGKLESSIVKFFSDSVQKKIVEVTKAEENDLLLFVADRPEVVAESLAYLRLKVAQHLNLLKSDEYRFVWVVDFPLFLWNEEIDNWEPAHHMFTMPKPDWLDKFDKDPKNALGTLYDLVLNGIELGSGSIRCNIPDIQERIMKVIGLSHAQAYRKFGFLLDAFKYGAPPHGGFAVGFDRLLALMVGTNDIREVIAFPKNKSAQCPMDGCPSPVDETTLKELHIKLDLKGKAKEMRPEQKLATAIEEGPTEDILEE
jgi:aspartyl-tRNA synthetase